MTKTYKINGKKIEQASTNPLVLMSTLNTLLKTLSDKEEPKPLQPSTDFEKEVDKLYNDKDFPNQIMEEPF